MSLWYVFCPCTRDIFSDANRDCKGVLWEGWVQLEVFSVRVSNPLLSTKRIFFFFAKLVVSYLLPSMPWGRELC